MADLSKIAVMVKTGFRDLYLFETLLMLQHQLSGVQIIVVDDGPQTQAKSNVYAGLIQRGHCVEVVPLDSGFGYKSNWAIESNTRPYLLVAADDFDFRPPTAREGVEDMLTVLENAPVQIAGGDALGGGHTGQYEFFLHDEGTIIREEHIKYDDPQTADGVVWHRCDLTRNYCLYKSEVLGWGPNQVHWNNANKIGGGEHGAHFVQLKRAGWKVAFVPSAKIAEQTGKPVDIRYPAMRGRARRPEREDFTLLGIKEYWTGNGGCDWKQEWMKR
jgi:hypothetical protein